ncbi:MAG: glycosyltransferase family 2 protein [Kiritimatiellia bacterium]|nr:glycosyltransferase family 2 protein [Kiritimatiellia bacterium]
MNSTLTISLLAIYTGLLIVLTIYAFHAYLMIFLYKRRRADSPAAGRPPKEWPLVTVQLPVYNEQYVIERLIHSVCSLDYPQEKLEVQVLDDSTDETREKARELADHYRKLGIDIHHIHRINRQGFKAGALKNGLQSAKGEFIAIFDADFVPQTDFLKKMIPHFSAPDIGMVQARWGHLNGNSSLLTRSQTIGLDAHFVLEHGARNACGIFINFNGTAGIWRKDTIVSAGNWQDDTLTEDIDISYRAQLAGWKFMYVNDVVCPAEIPAEVYGLKNQQYRWAKGAIQTAIKLLPAIWKNAKISPLMKFEATIHLTNHLVFPVLLLIALMLFPIMAIRINVPNTDVFFAIMSLFLINAFSYPLFYIYAQKKIYPDWKRRVLFVPILMAGAIGLTVINTQAVLSAILGRKSNFNRTPKFNLTDHQSKSRLATDRSWSGKKYRARFNATVLIELAFLLYISASLFYAFQGIQYLAIPFIFFYWLGFAFIGGLSLIHAVRQ